MFNLFDFTTGTPFCGTGPRDASYAERNAYLQWLADRDGVDVTDCTADHSGIWRGKGADAVCVVPMPGYGVTDRGTMETLDEDGNVLRSVPLALNKAGKLAITAEQIATACALPKVRKTRKAAAKPVEGVQPAAAPVEAPAPDIALVERVAALEAAFARMGLAVPDAAPIACNDNAAPPRRTEHHRAAVLRAWRMRGEMRARADLDRRALLQVNGDNRLLHDTLRQAERARDALVIRSDDMRDQRDAATARAADMERIALSYEADADALRTELADVRERAANDLRGALAEADALARRRERARTAIGASFPLPAPPPGVAKLPRVLLGAR